VSVRFAKIVFTGAGLGHRRAHAALLPSRRDRTSVRLANGIPSLLLWLLLDRDGLADRVPHDWVGPGAIPTVDDPEHDREVRIRLDSRSALCARGHLASRRVGCPARLAAGGSLRGGIYADEGWADLKPVLDGFTRGLSRRLDFLRVPQGHPPAIVGPVDARLPEYTNQLRGCRLSMSFISASIEALRPAAYARAHRSGPSRAWLSRSTCSRRCREELSTTMTPVPSVTAS